MGEELTAVSEAERRRALELNPTAVPQSTIYRDLFVPVASEYLAAYGGAQYTMRLAYRPDKSATRVYYAKVPEWNKVGYVVRPAGRKAA